MPVRLRLDEHGVAWATIDHPPVNLFDRALMVDVDRLGREVGDDPAVRVVVLDSANPDFWIAHADVEVILALPPDEPEGDGPGWFATMCDRFRTMPKPTIAFLEGRVRGGGSELALAFDLRIGVLGRTVLGQPEVPLGIVPGGGATQRLPPLVGRGRALEVLLSGDDVDAATAERWGWLDRALPADEARPWVEGLARRLATMPTEAVALVKEAVDAGGPLAEGLAVEERLFRRTAATEEARRRLGRFLELGGQTPERERDLGSWIAGELA